MEFLRFAFINPQSYLILPTYFINLHSLIKFMPFIKSSLSQILLYNFTIIILIHLKPHYLSFIIALIHSTFPKD